MRVCKDSLITSQVKTKIEKQTKVPFPEQCAPGTYYDRGTCKACPIGTFSEAFKSLSCSQCPEGTSTVQENSMSGTDCRGISLPSFLRILF